MVEHGAVISRYFRLTAHCERLGREREQELARRWRDQRDPKAAQELILAHLRFVTVIAARFRRYQVPVEDLISEGYVGLLVALEKFDPDRDIRFVTYASYWVRARIVDHVLASRSMASTGAGHLRSKLFFKLRRERARAMAQFGEGPACDSALCERLAMSEKRLKAVLHAVDQNDISLERPLGEGQLETFGDTLASEQVLHDQALDTMRAHALSRDFVAAALERLDNRERYVITHGIMAPSEEALSLAEIGRRLGVTRERARQLESRAKAKLKKHIEHQSQQLGACPRDLLIAA